MDDQKLAKEFEAYKEMAAQDKKIDVASLMLSALQQQQSNMLSSKTKKWAYLISLSVPPVGLIFAANFYFGGKEDGKQAAWVCIVLTVISLVLLVISAKLFLSGSSTSLQQIQQIKPSDLQGL